MRTVPGAGPSFFSLRLFRRCKTPALILALAASSVLASAAQAEQATRSKQRHPQISEQLTRVQTTVLRYTALIGLPAPVRQALRADDAPPDRAPSAAPCNSAGAAQRVVPCLGLQQGAEPPGNVKFRFDLALKSTAAPKDAFAPQCAAGTPCSTPLRDSLAEQERLADALSGQRRYPVATLGMALSF